MFLQSSNGIFRLLYISMELIILGRWLLAGVEPRKEGAVAPKLSKLKKYI